METELKLYSRDEIFRMLVAALETKNPLPPTGWSVVKLDRELMDAGKEYEPNLYLRHRDALATSVFYLVDFACNVPERVNLSTDTARVREICGDLADEIEQITYEPESVIARHGKLKAWLLAILAVQTCFIYREETERVIAEKAEAKRLQRMAKASEKKEVKPNLPSKQWQSALAQEIFQKISGRQNVSEQPSLF